MKRFSILLFLFFLGASFSHADSTQLSNSALPLKKAVIQKDSLTPDSISKDSVADSLAKSEALPISGKNAVRIVLEGTVDQGMADYTKRAIKLALAKNPDYIIFEINTFGGMLNAAFEIVDTITAIKSVQTIAYINQKAISAGALIALSCNKLYMKPSTTIGDCAPILQGEGGPQILGEKIQSPLRAKFRNLAQRNGYPELLSEAMVTPELEILELTRNDTVRIVKASEFESMPEAEKETWTKKILVHEGELLTMTDIEAQELGFSQGTLESLDELTAALEIKSTNKVEISWAETLARWLATISPFLMLIAFGAIYMEFQTPGFGVFGITGIVLLAIVFGGQYVSGLADKLPLVLLLLGIVLIFVEIIVFPGTWISGLIGVGFAIAALVLVLKDVKPIWQAPSLPGIEPTGLNYALTMVLGSALGAMVIPILISKYLLPRLPKTISPMLQDSLEGTAPLVTETQLAHVGDIGKAMTTLRPGGKVRIGSATIEAEAPYEMIDAGTDVRVIAVEATRIKVVRHQGAES